MIKSMPEKPIDEQFRLAVFERISRHTVGISTDNNTGVGTGSLISSNGERYILTAAHVIAKSTPDTLRFWLRSAAPIREKAAILTTNEEVGAYTAGITIPFVDMTQDHATDIAVLRIDHSFQLPDGSAFYDISSSHEFASWPEKSMDGLSLFMFGFPTDNSRLVQVEGCRAFHFLGCASLISEYSVDLNLSAWKKLSSSVSSAKHFVFKYGTYDKGIGPHGFSGAGIWIVADNPSRLVWNAEPILIGVSHKSFPISGLIAATKLPSIIHVEND